MAYSLSMDPPPLLVNPFEKVRHEDTSKIVVIFFYDNAGDADALAGVFFGHKRPRVAGEGFRPATDRAFIMRALAILEPALRGILGPLFQGPATWALSYTVEARGKSLTVVLGEGPFLDGAFARREFSALLVAALQPYAAYVPGLAELYSSDTRFPVIRAARGARRPLKPDWQEQTEFAKAYEPAVTGDLEAVHTVVWKPRLGALPVLWKPAAPAVPAQHGLLDEVLAYVRAHTEMPFTLAEVDGTSFEEASDRAWARLESQGFTCPAGNTHGAGTQATVELRGEYVRFTCLGPKRCGVFGFGDACCVEHYGPLPQPLFELAADETVDFSGVERADVVTLPQLDAWSLDPESSGRRAVGLHMRMASGKTLVAGHHRIQPHLPKRPGGVRQQQPVAGDGHR